MAFQPGDQIGQYEIVSELGRGGMATVFKAHQASMGRHVAIKVLPQQFLHDPTFLARFNQEARLIAGLEHPRILPVYDFGQAAGVPYIVMRLMPHGSLRERLRSGGLPAAEVARIVGQVAEALDYAHANHVIHRDLKPDNVLLDPAGNAYLSDFGIAKVVEASAAASGTMLVGTPKYMAPEQVKGRRPSPQTDIYALGAMVFELLTGRPPFLADDVLALMYMHANEAVPRLADHGPDAPGGLQAVIERAMAKSPEVRYATAGEFATALAADAQATAPAWPSAPPRAELPSAATAPDTPRPSREATLLEPAPQPASPPAGPLPPGLPVSRRGGMWKFGALALGGGALAMLALAAVAGALLFRPGLFGTELSATPVPVAGATAYAPADDAVMVFVPAGEFEMGSENGESDEQPAHTVSLDAFWIDRTEVTNAMYALCVEAAACPPPSETSTASHLNYFTNPAFGDYPVVSLTWMDAEAYCAWAGRRLPTEAEWEKAARGTDGREYPWGDTAPAGNRLNYAGQVRDTVEVGFYPAGASPYGALDMAGNVWEWVADRYDPYYYSSSPAQNPAGPTSGSVRVYRGGSHVEEADGVRTFNRLGARPELSASTIGFRCASSP